MITDRDPGDEQDDPAVPTLTVADAERLIAQGAMDVREYRKRIRAMHGEPIRLEVERSFRHGGRER